MTEFRRDKILPEDLIQRTNLSQHNMMIDAINDIDGRQGDIERVTNVNIDDITDLKTDVIALSNEKLDRDDIDADLHFGDITVTRDGTAVIMSLDVLNPTTGVVTPISFTIPGATSAEAGTMDASSVSWIADAEERISALEGLSDVKAVADLPGAPSQAQLTTGWVAVAGKSPETGDILQDINNSKLWVFVTDTWVLYGTIVTVPMATTSTTGGVRDTSLTAPGNRWYVHVEADGRLSLIGGDTLSTLVDTTVPAIQSGVNNSVKKTGNEEIEGFKTFKTGIYHKSTQDIGVAGYNSRAINQLYDVNNVTLFNDSITKETTKATGRKVTLGNKDTSGIYFFIQRVEFLCEDGRYREHLVPPSGSWTLYRTLYADGTGYSSTPYRSYAQATNTDILTKGHVADILAPKQDKLTFDSVPTTGSTNPVTSGGVKTAIDAIQVQDISLYEHTIRVTTSSGGPLAFTLTVLNQSATPFTLSTLRDYLGSASNDYKQCTGLAWRDPNLIDLIGVRGGGVNELVLIGIKRDLVTVDNQFDVNYTISLNWGFDATNLVDRVRQIV